MGYAKEIAGKDKVSLARVNPSEDGGLNKEEALQKVAALGAEMMDLLDLLYEAGQNGLLIILQGRDTSGKDGTIRRLLSFVNAQSAQVIPFKIPTPDEAAHDFLWRIHKQTPGRSCISIFNRSHYEDVLVVRVHNLVPDAVWKRRYDYINTFEKGLLDADTIILKFYLHISKDEQKQRLLDREKEVTKSWKLSVGDWKERDFWDDYTEAYEDALAKCGTKEAPWYIIPANHKWFRDVAVLEQIVVALRPYKKPWLDHLEKIGEVAKKEIAEYRRQKGGIE
jgi:PPK2 family polyphosphate:nucleotide phosphotransferase